MPENQKQREEAGAVGLPPSTTEGDHAAITLPVHATWWRTGRSDEAAAVETGSEQPGGGDGVGATRRLQRRRGQSDEAAAAGGWSNEAAMAETGSGRRGGHGRDGVGATWRPQQRRGRSDEAATAEMGSERGVVPKHSTPHVPRGQRASP